MSIRTNTLELLKNPDVSWKCRFCPDCTVINWVLGGDDKGIKYGHTEVIRCWNCGEYFWIDTETEEAIQDMREAVTRCGVPDLSIPQEMLFDLLHASDTCYMDMVKSISNNPQRRETIVELRKLRFAIKHIKTMLDQDKVVKDEQIHPVSQL